MSDEYICLNTSTRIEKLRKLYLNKCSQIAKAKLSSNHFRYQVLKAEADVIKSELIKG